MVTNYHYLNKHTIKNNYPLPLISQLIYNPRMGVEPGITTTLVVNTFVESMKKALKETKENI